MDSLEILERFYATPTGKAALARFIAAMPKPKSK